MKIKLSALVSSISGKLNGSVAFNGTYGLALRNKVTGVNPRTAIQTAVRVAFALLAGLWRTLTGVQQAAWKQAAVNFSTTNVFGDSFNYTGFNLYMHINRWLQVIGQAYNSTPPIPASVTDPTYTGLVAAIGLAKVEIAFTTPIPVTGKVVVRATPPLSNGKNFVKTEYRQLTVLNDGDATPKNLYALYIAYFGSIAGKAGMKIFVELQPVTNTGIAGVPSVQSAVIVA